MVKNLPTNAGDMGSIPGSGRSPGVRNGNPAQYSCLENSMDSRAWQTTIHGVTKSWDSWVTEHTVMMFKLLSLLFTLDLLFYPKVYSQHRTQKMHLNISQIMSFQSWWEKMMLSPLSVLWYNNQLWLNKGSPGLLVAGVIGKYKTIG